MSLRARVIAELATVYDPELDEPITDLGFVGSCVVTDERDVEVRLRLPTPQCAPNFAFLMAADARDAVRRLPEAAGIRIVLEDHYTGEEINAAVARGGGFDDAFPGETEGDLDALRELFRRKALVARQARACKALLDGGLGFADVTALRVRDLPGGDAEYARCLELRRELGLAWGPGDSAFVAGDGTGLTTEDLPRWLRRARLVSLSLDANGGLCRSLLAVRYGGGSCKTEEEVAA